MGKEELQPLDSKLQLTRFLILMMAVTAGITVSNLYYIQPLLNVIARSFHVAETSVGLAATLTQIGYALGMLFILPLADIREKKSLILLMMGCSACALIFVAFSQNSAMLSIASFILGFTSVTPQLIVPLAAQLAPPHERGQIIGTIVSGMLIGILLSRVFSGIIAQYWGWNTVYCIAASLIVLLGLFLIFRLPRCPANSKDAYLTLFRSMGELTKELPLLREAALSAALMFGTFNIFWTSLSFFLAGPPYHFGADAVGIFGVAGVAGAMMAPIAGQIADKKGTRFVLSLCIGTVTLSYLCYLFFGYHIAGLIIGIVLMDMGIQSSGVSNAARVHTFGDEARNRINTVYMVSTFLGGATGSYIGAYSFAHFGWFGVCISALLVQVAAAALHLSGYRRDHRSNFKR